MVGAPEEIETEQGKEQHPEFDESQAPRIGCVKGGGRPNALRYMPLAPSGAASVDVGFRDNHPSCPFCGRSARPAILMFGDSDWEDIASQQRRWTVWRRSLEDLIEAKPTALRVVILEIGAGGNVPTVRCNSESVLRSAKDAGADVKLIRIKSRLSIRGLYPIRT